MGEQPNQDRPEAFAVIAHLIRTRSEAAQLTAPEEIRQELIARKILPSPDEPAAHACLQSLLPAALAANEDLRELASPEGLHRYYSSRSLTDSYASILLRKEGDPLDLVAEVVRENSDKYPRPTSLEVFAGPPFDLARHQIQACLEQMKGRVEYEDISAFQTSLGTVFLYSAWHLDPAHASALAEWLEVGQFENP